MLFAHWYSTQNLELAFKITDLLSYYCMRWGGWDAFYHWYLFFFQPVWHPYPSQNGDYIEVCVLKYPSMRYKQSRSEKLTKCMVSVWIYPWSSLFKKHWQPTGYVGYFTASLGKYNATFKIVLDNRTRGRTGTPLPTISPSASFTVLATSIPAFAFAVFESFINAAHWSEQLRLSPSLVILVAGGVLSLRCALAVVWLPGRISHCHKEGRVMGRHCTRSRDCHRDVTAKGDKLSS